MKHLTTTTFLLLFALTVFQSIAVGIGISTGKIVFPAGYLFAAGNYVVYAMLFVQWYRILAEGEK